MSEDQSNNDASSRSWFERISQALLGEPQDRKQLLELLRDAEQRNLLDADALTMIERVLQVSELRVRDIMVPRSQMVVVEQQAPLKESVAVITESGHSRFPVIGDGRDDVNGILLAKDLLAYMSDNQDDFNIKDLLRPAVFIPESKRLNVLLKEFRANRNHMAIVVDEYSGVSGVITIEDVLEQIVGDIEDEHDIDEDISIKEHGKGQFTVEALTPLDEFNKYFGLSLDETEFDTIGGFVVNKFGYLPQAGEQVSLGDLEFKVLRASTRRVQLLQVVHHP